MRGCLLYSNDISDYLEAHASMPRAADRYYCDFDPPRVVPRGHTVYNMQGGITGPWSWCKERASLSVGHACMQWACCTVALMGVLLFERFVVGRRW